ncbi:MAG TPA: DUF2795 domain-containing protein [Acidimicrobiia bacterium]|nr:DUF2795 domain-containing protein [Acidimicrobiia bacterium]
MSVDQKVTRLEIAEAVRAVFEGGSATRDEIVAAADSASRREVVDVLKSLPDRRYSRLNELWEELADVPVGA